MSNEIHYLLFEPEKKQAKELLRREWVENFFIFLLGVFIFSCFILWCCQEVELSTVREQLVDLEVAR